MKYDINTPARRTLAALALASLLLLISGCSTLGIATKKNLEEADTRLTSTTRETNTRVSQLDERTKDSQASMAELSARLDSLNARFAQAADWIQALDLDNLSQQASEATAAALAIEEQNRAFMTKYLEWLKAQQALLADQVTMLESKMNAAEQSSSAPADTSGSQ